MSDQLALDAYWMPYTETGSSSVIPALSSRHKMCGLRTIAAGGSLTATPGCGHRVWVMVTLKSPKRWLSKFKRSIFVLHSSSVTPKHFIWQIGCDS